ncbi:MAG: hypothetical protein K6E39_06100 [Lachnospiraceae bacterium]|nr:hypothetical protein [Lachnospiraceae bacterium]
MNFLRKLLINEDGITTVELILVLVVLIAIVLIFKEQLLSLVDNIFDTITKGAGEISA